MGLVELPPYKIYLLCFFGIVRKTQPLELYKTFIKGTAVFSALFEKPPLPLLVGLEPPKSQTAVWLYFILLDLAE